MVVGTLTRYDPATSKPRTIIRSRACTCFSCAPALHAWHLPTTKLLQPGRRDPFDLAISAISSFQNGPKTFGQHHARRAWREWWLQSEDYNLLWNSSNLNLTDPQILEKPLIIFSNLFFLGQLPSRTVRIEWCFFGATSREQGRTLIQPEGVLILLNPHHNRHRRSPTGILCTLLHEMCHAFLGRYSCYQGAACGTSQCRTLCDQNYGSTGHGRAWQLLAKAIEEEASALLTGLSVRLGRREMAMLEIERGGFWPSVCDMRSVRRDFAVVAKVWMKKVIRDDDDVMDAKLNKWVGRGSPNPLREVNSMPCVRLGVA